MNEDIEVNKKLETMNIKSEAEYWSKTEKGRIAEDCLNNIDPYEVSCWVLLIKEAKVK